jgi:hypothetical protein
MSSNNYAEPTNSTKIKVLDGIRQHKVFHFEITPANDICWGKGGQDIDRLECGNSFVTSRTRRCCSRWRPQH